MPHREVFGYTMNSILFLDDLTQPLGTRLRHAWLLQFPQRAGLIFYFCREDEEYQRLLMGGPSAGRFCVVTDPGNMTMAKRFDAARDQSYLVFCPDLRFLETARLGDLLDQQVIAVFPAGFEQKERLFEIYPEADWCDEALVFADLEEMENWKAELSRGS
jgi:hypothetical protein